jgi:DNA helicase-2/ATP-dependent DNA helicase PcrA
MLQALEYAGEGKAGLTDKTTQACRQFAALIQDLRQRVDQTDLARFLIAVVNETGYLGMWQAAPHDEGAMRVENINELIQAADEFSRSSEGTLKAFLEQIALVSSWDEADDKGEQVTLMTFHSAKGLEFPLVFMVGMEEGLFPHSNALQDEHGLDEERRLCYVGITRARERLVLTGAATRTSFGNRIYNSESRFLHEIPARLFIGHKPLSHQKEEQKNEGRGLWKDQSYDETKTVSEEAAPEIIPDDDPYAGLTLGLKVRHARYGLGTVVGKLGEGDDLKIEIAFVQHGRKKMIARFAALQPVTSSRPPKDGPSND